MIILKVSKIRLPILISASVLLCVIMAVLSLIVINSADNNMMSEQINEHKFSMQQTTEKVQKDISAKYAFICNTADTLSNSGKTFEELSVVNNLKNYAESSGFACVMLVNTDGSAYSSSDKTLNVSDREYFQKAIEGKPNISGRVKSSLSAISTYIISYTAPVYSEGQVIAVLCGITPADMNISDYTDYAVNPYSGMYILDGAGKLVMSSPAAEGSSFYEAIKDSKYADGTDSSYQPLENELTAASNEETADSEAVEPPAGNTDFYAGDITNSRGFLGWLTNHETTSNIYFKKQLAQNDWTLFYVRSVNLSDSAVSFIIVSRVMLFIIVIIFLVSMIIMLWLQWKNAKKITDLAYKDETTGRANWQKFTISCGRFLNKKGWWTSNYAALHIDINRFTLYNDYYGHKAGDKFLQYFAEKVDLMCSAKEICARRSSDKFVVLWSYSDMEHLQERINELFAIIKDGPNGENMSLTVGVYLLSEQDKDIVHAMDMAKMAGQSVGESKKNTTVFFDEKVRAAMTEEHELERLMHTALENDEFKLYLQPKHGVQSGALEGAEALVRWISPEKGFISPGKFIPLFEKNGFVAQVDNYILKQLCKFQKQRLASKKKVVPISVNVSRVQLSNPNLAEEICAIVDKYKVPHKYIDLELTESACFDDMDVLISTMSSLREMGFAVSMDDFGSGYSSLNLLKELPFDTLKIDGEFFRNVSDLNRANIVVRNIIDLAKSLDMKVVAEGIETEEQVKFLRTTECDLIQGYYYSKPISADDFSKYMKLNNLR